MSDTFRLRREFWAKYDAFADKFGKDMTGRLNTNLDVLLIFAGLFSAVNTAFIVVALAALSANPVDKTNHPLRLLLMNANNHTITENDLIPPFVPGRAAIRQNCIFIASLCCSLFAAAGAVLGEQWLQSYERTGKFGPVDQQAIRRTEKFIGAENWGLRPVVETLATLLLVSLALFFIALVDYLWDINKTVAIVVLAFAAAEGLLYILAVVLAAIFPTCPFQTGPSTALRLLYHVVQRKLFNIDSERFHNTLFRRRPHEPEHNQDFLYAHSAILMTEAASNADKVIAVADNIPLISNIEAVQLIATSTVLQTLLSHLQKSFLETQKGQENDFTNALMLTRAIAYIMLVDPNGTSIAVRKRLAEVGENQHYRSIPTELHLLFSCIRTLCGPDATNYPTEGGAMQQFVKLLDLISQLAVQDTKSTAAVEMLQGNQLNSTAIIWLRHCAVTTTYNRWDEEIKGRLVQELGNLFLFEGLKPDAAYLSRVMDALLTILWWHPLSNHHRDRHLSSKDSASLHCAWNVPRNRQFTAQLLDTLDEFSRHYYSECPLNFSPFICRQTRLLAHVNTLYASYDVLRDDHLPSSAPLSIVGGVHSSLNWNVERLLSIDTSPPWACTREGIEGCGRAVINTLNLLLLTSTARESIDQGCLAGSARLTLRVETISEKEKLLQAILFSIFSEVLRSSPKGLLVAGSRHDLLQKGEVIGILLASALKLSIWLYCSATPNQAWIFFESFLRFLANDDTPRHPAAPVKAPEAWDIVVQLARDDEQPRYCCVAPFVVCLSTKIALENTSTNC
ncbi:hypothetical protein FRB94_009997 [Tulasnella sp. JGI-2019a]|nr:hypothetical protein FRB94_009997 [Tulasnella sp. JGI-2019a]